MSQRGLFGLIGGAVGALLLVITLFLVIEVIPQGHAGVVYSRNTGVQEETLPQGWRFVKPWERITPYPVSTETVTVQPFNVQTKDGKPLAIELQYDYKNEVEKLPYIYDKFKGQGADVIQQGWLQSRVKKATLNVFSQYSVLEVFQQQGPIGAKIQEEFIKLVSEHGFTVDSLTLGAPQPDANTMAAIQAVVDASQKLEQLEIEKKQAKAQAEKDIEQARGQAEAVLIKAKADAQANALLEKSLTENVVNYKALAKWDGKLPQVTGGSTPMISIPGASK